MTTHFSESTEHIDVRYVANLARMELSDDEALKFQKQLDQVLDYVKQLEDLDLGDAEPMSHTIPLKNVFRKDEPRPTLDRETVLANSPAESKKQILVPKIIE